MQHNSNVNDHNQSVKDSATSTNSIDNSIELDKLGENKRGECLEDKHGEDKKGKCSEEKLGEDKKSECLEDGVDENKMTEALDIVYEKSSCDVRSGIISPSSLSARKSDSMSEYERMITQVKKQTRWLIIVIGISNIIFFVSALILFAISVYFSRQKITQLVGKSIPQVTAGFGVLTISIFLLGFMANRRSWICGFKIQALCLVVLLVSETLVMCNCVFQKYEIMFTSDIYWTNLSDAGKARVMANWQCCGWSGTCDISNRSSLNFQYRHFVGSSCLAATDSETTKWTTDVATIFGLFVLFDLLYMIYTTCHYKKLQRERQKIVKKVADEKRKRALSRRISTFAMSISPRFRPSNVARRISLASISPRFRGPSFGRHTRAFDTKSSKTYVRRDNEW